MRSVANPDRKELVIKYLYSKVDGVTLTYGRIRRRGGIDEIPVYFERESQNGDFDFAEGVAPQCVFHRSKGFSELELSELSRYLQANLLLLFEDAYEKRDAS